MNTSQLKAYAPKARKDFLAAVTAQAAIFGITKDSIAPAQTKGDLLLVGRQVFPKSFSIPRSHLVERGKQDGFAATIVAIADALDVCTEKLIREPTKKILNSVA